MDPLEIYAKTERGTQALMERKLDLPAPLRDLLVLVDGNRTIADVMVEARALKLDGRGLAALERGGLIARRTPAPSLAKDEAAVAGPRSAEETERYVQARQLMSDAITAHLGFRGYALTKRLQKACDVHDLHGLLPDFAKALVKRLGIEPAAPIVASIERLVTGS